MVKDREEDSELRVVGYVLKRVHSTELQLECLQVRLCLDLAWAPTKTARCFQFTF